jgi:hypothetical protein
MEKQIVIPGVSNDLHARIKEHAKAEGRSLASEVRLLLARNYPATASAVTNHFDGVHNQ